MSPEMQQAFQACRSLMPQGGFSGRNRRDPAALQAFTTCMQDNGVTMPSPSGQGGGFRGLDRNDPKVAKALKKCQVLLPTPSPAPSA
jgi:hypothetical protein